MASIRGAGAVLGAPRHLDDDWIFVARGGGGSKGYLGRSRLPRRTTDPGVRADDVLLHTSARSSTEAHPRTPGLLIVRRREPAATDESASEKLRGWSPQWRKVKVVDEGTF